MSRKPLDHKKKFRINRNRRNQPREATMAFRRSDLQEAFFVPGRQPFRARLASGADHQDRPEAARAYGTGDPLEAVLAPDDCAATRGMLRPGELIYVSMAPHQVGPGGVERGARGTIREPQARTIP
jgi:hypothetical protein